MPVLINIDVPDLEAGIAFYTQGLGLTLLHRYDTEFVELGGAGVRVFLLLKHAGTRPAPGLPERLYTRHWSPIHFDFQVDDVPVAVARAVAAGAVVEAPTETKPYGQLAMLADPFGHGFCLISLTAQGYGVYLPCC
ncbi:VOC family protein [Chitiniphilus eburneus]|uniref:VOC family protein n=1 Tax=Chitiniphilus eburneus TaxID=2571148 RepID=A0A4U0PA50_9NEIS|nr:VOC family protein [Chitiniphilus eburneus]TJZ64495.1 VOC family protein [Chitiniphilus eburneus]